VFITQGIAMKRVMLACCSLLLGVAAATAATAPATTDPGDLGPPRGAPIEEAMVAPPNVPAPIHRTTRRA